jgi:hypothetical protein
MTPNETVTQCLTGNGLVIERTEKSGGATPWFWIADKHRISKSQSQTYRYREILKANGCRWSKKRNSWYFIGPELPDEIATLLDLPATSSEMVVHLPPCAPQYSPTPTTEVYQVQVLRRFVEQFQADLERLTRYPALPAIATIRLDDPWA